MKLKRIFAIMAAVVLLAGLAAAQRGNTPEARLRAAMDKETVDGDLKAAIEGYKQVIGQKGASKEVVAQALLRLGMAYEKQGSAEARKQFERIVKEFGDQPVAAQARARMAAGATVAAVGPSLTKVCANDCQGMISPDGRWLVARQAGALVIRDLTSVGSFRVLVEAPKVGILGGWSISRDGKKIAYSHRFRAGETGPDRIYLVGTDGGPSRQVFEDGWPLGWAPNGARLLVTQDGVTSRTEKMSWLRVADGAVQPLLGEHYNLDVAVVSPDGKYVAFNASPDPKGDEEENVYIVAADGSGEVRVSPSPIYQEPVGWTPDGKSLIYEQYDASRGLWTVPVSGGKPQGASVRTSRHMTGNRASARVITADSKLYYVAETSASDIYSASMDPVTGRVTSVPVAVPTPSSGTNVAPSWAPDGRRLIYGMNGPQTSQGGARELHLFSFDDSTDHRVATNLPLAGGAGVCWSPDGAAFFTNLFTSDRPQRQEPSRVDLTSGEAKPVFPGAANFRMFSCSPTSIATVAGTSIRLRNLPSGADAEVYKLKRAATNNGIPVLSRDGRSVAFVESLDDNTETLMVVPTGGGTARELVRLKAPAELQIVLGVAWSADDKFVYFLKRANANASHELFRIPAAGGREESMGLSAADIRDLNIAPDGRHIAFSIGSVGKPEIWSMENFLP